MKISEYRRLIEDQMVSLLHTHAAYFATYPDPWQALHRTGRSLIRHRIRGYRRRTVRAFLRATTLQLTFDNLYWPGGPIIETERGEHTCPTS